MATDLLITTLAYMIGSIPTAVFVSKLLAGVDIRMLGDGNMGSRNVTRTLGPGAGLVVAGADVCKGAGAVVLARIAGRSPLVQLLAGGAAVLGHDFPILAGFRGGQGMATCLGVLSVLLPVQTLMGLGTFALAYLLSHNFDLSAAFGLGLIVLLTIHSRLPTIWALYAAALFVSIGLKKAFDLPYRRRLAQQREGAEPEYPLEDSAVKSGWTGGA